MHQPLWESLAILPVKRSNGAACVITGNSTSKVIRRITVLTPYETIYLRHPFYSDVWDSVWNPVTNKPMLPTLNIEHRTLDRHDQGATKA
jgi:hypothetical protein